MRSGLEEDQGKVFHLMKQKTLPFSGKTLGQVFIDELRNCGRRNGIAYKLAVRTLAIRDGWEGKKRPRRGKDRKVQSQLVGRQTPFDFAQDLRQGKQQGIANIQ